LISIMTENRTIGFDKKDCIFDRDMVVHLPILMQKMETRILGYHKFRRNGKRKCSRIDENRLL